MLGKYDIEVYNNRVHYYLTVKRNITLINGDSGTGKSELIRLIGSYETDGASSGVTLKCERRCRVLTSVDWELRLSAMKESIIFIDEMASFTRSVGFAEKVKGSDNYFVIVTRDSLMNLPYSVDEIYGLRDTTDSQKYRVYHRTYNEMYRLYNLNTASDSVPEKVITEDSNSGFEFFSILYQGRCCSAHGKSSVYTLIRENRERKLLVIVDGAAFGSEMAKVMDYIRSSRVECTVYAPESFEYLILLSGVIDCPESITTETYRFADSCKYTSWEEFYTEYLRERTRNTACQYSKSKLSSYYRTERVVRMIASVLPSRIREDN